MKKLLVFTLLILLILPSVLAIDITLEKQDSSRDTIIKGLNQPAIIDLKITNHEDRDDEFLFYNLLN